SVSGDTAVVGSWFDDDAGSSSGSAYVFSRSGATWTEQAKLTASDAAAGDDFGVSVSVSGDAAVVGSWFDDDAGSSSGSAYVFSRSGSTWTQQAKLTATDAAAFDDFGVSVSVSGDTAVVGSVFDDDAGPDSGSAYVFVFDVIPPDTFVTSGPPGVTNSSSATFEFMGTDNHTPSGSLTFTCSLDAAPASPCTSPATYTGLAEGAHTFSVAATDAAGNTDPTPATHAWTIDTTPPDTTITSGPPSPSDSASATLQFTSTEPGSTFTCSLDAAPASPCTSPVTYTGLADGSHTFSVAAIDAAGNTDPTPATHTWTIDIPPDTFVTSGPPEVTTSSSATFEFLGTDNRTPSGALTFTCSLDAAPASPCTSPVTYTGLADGSHTFSVAATDAVGNTDPTPATRTWSVDATGPQIQLDTADGDVVANVAGTLVVPVRGQVTDASADVASVQVTFTAQSPGASDATVSASLACGPTGGSCAWRADPPRATGIYAVTVRGTDALGNVGDAAGPVTVVVVGAG
ncbi:MAG TPA: Ig-like domain-containing protein, partial [Actinomycetota bacterium]